MGLATKGSANVTMPQDFINVLEEVHVIFFRRHQHQADALGRGASLLTCDFMMIVLGPEKVPSRAPR